ncbi:MAG TPA: 50S ribosomal protein L3 N(5)-glutamine methyltransferase [Hyphomicrobiaceae bacterium]|nr:50S ribosomal protein L3 N(5)-glutamine methyltransferase [Hyphomicrobiaceae bacterium]
MAEAEELAQTLLTVRDWLRYSVSRFSQAGLVYGHGTATALDEAAYLILHTLQLPIDQLDPWLDARLTLAERQAVGAIIAKRIATRKPAPYLTNEAWVQGHAFYVDERVIVPRSYIGELLGSGLSAVVADPEAVDRVLDLCTGSGCLAILAALALPNAVIDASDISADALTVAERNIATYELGDRIALVRSDVFAGLAGRTYDLILSNPPYVSAAAVAAFPPEYAAEPRLAHLGGEHGLDIVLRILAEASAHLTETGVLVVEIGTGREVLEETFPGLPFLWLDSADSAGEVFALTAQDLKGKKGR